MYWNGFLGLRKLDTVHQTAVLYNRVRRRLVQGGLVGPASQTVAANWTLMATYWNRLAQSAAPGEVPQIERLTLSWTPEAPPAPRAPTPMPVVNGASVSAAPQATPAVTLAAHLGALLPLALLGAALLWLASHRRAPQNAVSTRRG